MMGETINVPPPSDEQSLTSCTGASKLPLVPDPETLLYYSPPPPPSPPSSFIPSPPVVNAVPPSSPTIPPSVPIVSPPDYQQSVVTPVPPPTFSPPPPPPLLSSPDPYANAPSVSPPVVLSPPPPVIESPPPPSLHPPIAHSYQSPPPLPLPPAAPTVSYASPPPPAARTISYASPPPAARTVSYASPPPPAARTVLYASPPPPVFSPPPPYRSSSPRWPSPPFRSVPPPVRRKSPPLLPSATRPPPARPLRSNIPQESISGTVATLAVVAGLVMLTFAGAIVWFVKKQKRPIDDLGRGIDGVIGDTPAAASSYASGTTILGSMSNPPVRYQYPYSPSEPGGLGNTRSWFTLEDLSIITNGFSDQNLLGEGGFGCVYKGQLSNGREVAVKQLKVGGSQGEREFKAEVETISRVHHRHLVSLVGYCITENQRLLVYDYVPNKTLHYQLHGQGMPVLTWSMRVKIATGAARGIAYLHEDCHPRIIHRDIKSSNILLDNNFEAQVSDFGLARSAVDSNTHVTTRVMGTFGYLAPEYASSGKLTAKSDVYSFGVVLLELITGRRPVDTSQPLGEESVVEWARPMLMQAFETGDLGDLPDARLEGNYVRDEVFHMMEVAAACVRHSSHMRPRMGQVVRALASFGETDINNGVRPGHSQVFSESQQSEEIRRFQRTRFDDYSSDRSRSNWISRSDL